MASYSYYYVKTIVEDGRPPKTYKFAKGYPVQATKDAWSTVGRYNLLSRLLRGGLSGSGDVHHPAHTTFKVCYYDGSTRAKHVQQSNSPCQTLSKLLITRFHVARFFFERTTGAPPNSLLNVKHEPSHTAQTTMRHIFSLATSDILPSC